MKDKIFLRTAEMKEFKSIFSNDDYKIVKFLCCYYYSVLDLRYRASTGQIQAKIGFSKLPET